MWIYGRSVRASMRGMAAWTVLQAIMKKSAPAALSMLAWDAAAEATKSQSPAAWAASIPSKSVWAMISFAQWLPPMRLAVSSFMIR